MAGLSALSLLFCIHEIIMNSIFIRIDAFACSVEIDVILCPSCLGLVRVVVNDN